MAVTPKFKISELMAEVQVKKRQMYQVILLNLQRVGEQFVILGRNTRTYTDRTGNLRSSIGYIILQNGRTVSQDFQTTGGKEGVAAAKRIAREVAKNYPTGFVLIGVAGMNYAAAVESKGYDVITGASDVAARMLKKAMTRLKRKLS